MAKPQAMMLPVTIEAGTSVLEARAADQVDAAKKRRRAGAATIKTVRRCLWQSEWKPYGRVTSAPICSRRTRGWLTERAPQVRFLAGILFQELRAIRGYRSGYDTVRNAAAAARRDRRRLSECRLETAPGGQARPTGGRCAWPLAAGRWPSTSSGSKRCGVADPVLPRPLLPRHLLPQRVRH
jgi:hypothetical protein